MDKLKSCRFAEETLEEILKVLRSTAGGSVPANKMVSAIDKAIGIIYKALGKDGGA